MSNEQKRMLIMKMIKRKIFRDFQSNVNSFAHISIVDGSEI